MNSRVDLGKARTMLYHLSRSKQKIEERTLARRKLEAKLTSLKKISTKTIQKHLHELEKHIKDTISKERQIVKVQADEEDTHHMISQKIDLLESKLSKYLASKETRQKRIQELENKVRGQIESKKEKIKNVAKQVKALEQLYNQAKKDKKFPQTRLKTIKKKIDLLKEKLKIIRK